MLKDGLSGAGDFEIYEVTSYDDETRRPLTIKLCGRRSLTLRQDGSYSLSAIDSPSEVESLVSNVRLNQRTGRLTWKDDKGLEQALDIKPHVSNDQKAVEAVIIFALFLFPPAWPLLLFMLIRLAIRDACERIERRISTALDWLYGAYDE